MNYTNSTPTKRGVKVLVGLHNSSSKTCSLFADVDSRRSKGTQESSILCSIKRSKLFDPKLFLTWQKCEIVQWVPSNFKFVTNL